jgi:hypothetical protein
MMQPTLSLRPKSARKWVLNKYYIWYNTQHGESDLVWRVFDNGKEHLVKNFYITTPMFGESTMENGIQKWNVACEGALTIKDDVAYIEQ